MGNVILLNPQERISRDIERLLDGGERRALVAAPLPKSVDVALEDLAETLSCTAVAYRERRLDAVADHARDAADQARYLGLNRTFRVSQAVASLATREDGAALAANVARLMRLGDVALSSIWEYNDTLC